MKIRDAIKYSIYIIPLLFLLPLPFIPFEASLSIFPWKERVYEVGTYSDGDGLSAKTGSTIDFFKVDEAGIKMAYTLRDRESYPYAGMFFSFTGNPGFIDLSMYTHLKFKLEASRQDIYKLIIKTQIDGHTMASDSNSRCPLEKAIILETHMREYTIPLKEFEFLNWWFTSQKLDPAQYNPHELLKKTPQINIQITKQIPPGTEDKGTLIIKEVSLYGSQALVYILAGTCFFLSAGIVTIIVIRASRKKTATGMPLEYNQVELPSYLDEDTNRLIALIQQNYTNPAMSVEELYKQTGISKQRIALVIRKKYNLPFKQLLNRIRLTEAARLLKETDRNITDIAMALGFSSSTYFFQVFKSAFQISPTDFRKQNRTANI